MLMRPASKTHASALATLDGRSIDEGTSLEDARTIDVEDYAVLFEIEQTTSELETLAGRDPEEGSSEPRSDEPEPPGPDEEDTLDPGEWLGWQAI